MPDQKQNDNKNISKKTENITETPDIYFGSGAVQNNAEAEPGKSNEANQETAKAGAAKRKDFGDTQLNKGLEAQAMDEES